MTSTSRDDPFWAAFEDALTKEYELWKSSVFDSNIFRDCKFTKEIFPAATDSRYIRGVSHICIFPD